jgi:hypothetical protein
MYRGLAYTLIGLLLLGSCTSETTIEDPVDIVPKSERDYSFQEEENEAPKLDIPTGFEELVAFVSEDTGELQALDSTLYVNRFGPNEELSFLRYASADTTEWYIYQFADSLKTVNAFYNWLDCFSTDCQSLSIRQEAKLKDRAGFVWVSNQWIIVVFIRAGKPKFERTFWDEFIEEDQQLFYLHWKKNGKLNWWMAEEIQPKA